MYVYIASHSSVAIQFNSTTQFDSTLKFNSTLMSPRFVAQQQRSES